jgi:hypothetical protein
VVREWREAFTALAAGCSPLTWAEAEVRVYLRDMRGQDVGGALPAAKAAIDGVVDAGVLPGDDPRYLHRLSFVAPVLKTYDALELVLTGESA